MPVIIACPHCSKSLSVPDEAAGKMVRCPTCQNAFPIAIPAEGLPSVVSATPPSKADASPPAAWDKETPAARRRREEAEAKEERERQKSPFAVTAKDDDEDDEDDRPKRKKKAKQADDDNPFSLGDDDGSHRPPPVPHRGGTILALGILSFVLGCFPLSFVTISMANADLIRMAAQRMDPDGKSMTQIGKTLAIVQLILFTFGMFVGCCGFIGRAAVMHR